MEISKEDRTWLISFTDDLEYFVSRSKENRIWFTKGQARDIIANLNRITQRKKRK